MKRNPDPRGEEGRSLPGTDDRPIAPFRFARAKRSVFVPALLVVLMAVANLASAQTVPEEARRHMVRGQAAVEMARMPAELEGAIREFTEAARIAPNWPDPYYNLGIVQEKVGKLKEAVASLKEYVRLAPNAPDAGKVRDHIYKLEYKAEQVLTVSDIIDVLVSSFSLDRVHWKVATQDARGADIPQGGGRCGGGWGELDFSRNGGDSVKVLQAVRYYPVREYYQTLIVTGPVLKYTTVVNVCDKAADREEGGCDAVTQHEVEVVSRDLIKVKQTVLRGGVGAGVVTGDKGYCIFQRKP